MGSRIHKKVIINEIEADRISNLSDELIHQILSFLDTRLAVQTSVLSKRWKLIWKTIHFLHFDEYAFDPTKSEDVFEKLVLGVFSHRNHHCNIIKLKLHILNGPLGFDETCLEDCVKYAFRHNLEELNVGLDECELSIFSSKTLKKLKLVINFELGSLEYSKCWDLPALTSLHLKHFLPEECPEKVPDVLLTCLPSLTYLRLDHISLPGSFALPALKTLHLVSCDLPGTIWDLPALVSLVLAEIDVPVDISNYLCVLFNLQYLRLFFCFNHERDFLIPCPQLLYLEVRSSLTEYGTLTPNILIFAPKLCNLVVLGIFTITCGASKLENVTINLRGCFGDETAITWDVLKQYSSRILFMLPGLGSARTLTLDEDTVEVLSFVSSQLKYSASPFYNLRYVKLPHRYMKSGSGLSCTTKSYLLGASPGATIVTSFPQDNLIPQMVPISRAADVMQEEHWASPTMELNNSQGIHRKICSDSLAMKVKEAHGVENSGLFDREVGQVGTLLQVFGGVVPNTLNTDQASSSRGKNEFGLWHGHEVKSEFVGLLELIMEKYPETFEHFTTKSKTFCSMKLSILCTSIHAFITTAMTEIDTETITEYRTLFSYLQSSFNVQWLVNHLNYIEQLQFSYHELPEVESCIDDASSKSKLLPTLGTEKMTKIGKAFGTIGTKLAASDACIEDNLLPDP